MNVNYDPFAKKSRKQVIVSWHILELRNCQVSKIGFSELKSRFQRTDLCLGNKDPWTTLYVSITLMGYLEDKDIKKKPKNV